MSIILKKIVRLMVITIVILLFQLLFISSSFAKPVMKDLGTLGEYSEATAINNNGQVVGYYYGYMCSAFIWQDNKMIDLGIGEIGSYASAINNNGQVVGWVEVGPVNGFIWENGKKTVLKSLKYGSMARGINENGQVVGSTLLDDYSRGGLVMWDNGKVIDLGGLGGYSEAESINDKGQVVGVTNNHGFIWDNGKLSVLEALGGYSEATGINNKGQVVGYSYFTGNNGAYHAFIWEDGKTTDLGTLGGSFSWASGINDKGQVVGYSYLADGTRHAFIWENGKMTDLGTLGGDSSYASAINDKGQVVGSSYLADNKTLHGFIWEDDGSPIITIDQYNSNITNKDITVTASVYNGTLNETSHTFTENGSFTFTATNDAGSSSQTVTITNIDKSPPVITLSGSLTEYIMCNSNYIDKGAKAIDDIDGDITSLISVSGSVYTSESGTYSITYSVYDKAGNAAIPVTRTIIVMPGNTISYGFDLSSPEDIKITYDGDSNLIAVKNGPTALTDSDYSISGNTVIIKKSYLTYFFTKYNLSSQKLYLTFDFDTGKDPVATINRVFTSNTIAAQNTTFDPSNPQDIVVSIKGNKLNGIKNGPTALTNWDYSISGDTVTIKKSYLIYFFTKYYSPSQKLYLTFDFNVANDPVLTINRKQ